jgi:hypothetical protein
MIMAGTNEKKLFDIAEIQPNLATQNKDFGF